MDNNKNTQSADGFRDTQAYADAIHLLNEKNALQARLRGVDKLLRELEKSTIGVISIARDDLNREARDIQGVCIHKPV